MIGKIRIEGDGYPGRTRIFLDGQEITHLVLDMTVRLESDALPEVTLTCRGTVEFSGEIDAQVKAYLLEMGGAP